MKKKAKAINDAIDDLFGDMTVSEEKMIETLEDIQSNVDGKIEALKEQIKNRK